MGDVLKSNMTASKPSANMLWGGRFTGGLDPLMVSYNESIYFDRAIYAQDIRGSIAYARANAKFGLNGKTTNSRSNPVSTRTFTLLTNVGSGRSLAHRSPESCTQAEAAMTKLVRACGSGCEISCARSNSTSSPCCA